jgi:tRNA dimethylallyltransferase
MSAQKPARPLVVILGPTAVGKTSLSLGLAERFDGEIVGADSRQVYREMDIGTAKPTPAEQARVPHHLIDIVTPDKVYTAAEFQADAYAAIDAMHARGRVPFLVGGTILWVRAVVEGLRMPAAPPNPALRAELEAVLAEQGRGELFRRLQALDPATAAVIDADNPRRLLRALEIVITTGRPKVELEGADPPPYTVFQIGLDRPRPVLYERIDRRVEEMVAQGLVEETRRLLAAGYDPRLPAMTGLGYREMTAYLAGELTLAEAVARIQVETHRFVRHQYTWFRRLQGVVWFNLEKAGAVERVHTTVATFLATA